MNSLRSRVVVLCALVAVLATALAGWSAGRAAESGLDAQEDHAAHAAAVAWHERLDQALDTMVFEVRDYAAWDELYHQMPTPDPAWTAINLLSGGHEGALVGHMALAQGEAELIGRYHHGRHGGLGPQPGDELTDSDLRALLRSGSRQGVAWTAGGPILFARSDILTSTGAGPARGILLGYTPFSRAAAARRLESPGWQASWTPETGAGVVITRAEQLRISFPVEVAGQGLRVTLSRPRQEAQRVRDGTVLAVYGTGALAAVLAGALGAVLAVHWMRPLRRLAQECRTLRQPQDLSDGGELEETRALAQALRALLAAERKSQTDLGAALEHTRHVADIHRAFLTGLAQEFGLPVARLHRLLAIDPVMPLTPEDRAEARSLVELLGERLRDAAVVGDQTGSHPAVPAIMELAPWASGVADLVRPTAQQRGIALVVHGAGSAPVAGAALSAILINLLANAVRAATTTVQLAVTADEHGAVRLLVADDGPGFPPELAERLRAAAIRGEILPGEPGFGLGLSLVVDRIRSLRGHLVLARSDAAGSCLEVHLPPPGQE